YLLEAIFKAAGEKVGVIGTVNFRYDQKIIPSTHTTPGATELQALLAEMKNAQVSTVIMEVSSHALKMRRTDGIEFDGVIFTNLSREHLDFHPDMDDYFNSKARLFTELLKDSVSRGKPGVALIEGQDLYGQKLLEKLKKIQSISVATFGMSSGFDFHAQWLQADLTGIRGKIGGHPFHLRLAGDFNILNTLAAIGMAEYSFSVTDA
ncbi:UDP-N-acetylmuramoyl-L-alanyl-D-glutamate--2,6-diaminopimelate ligase, partial [bacterium]|nr:UDP-N-acetylmuramoyl-L-alanyl-D-glutamate--2,6-diaminopimelate ligase [bacterium]